MLYATRSYSLTGFFCALPACAYAADGVLVPGITGLVAGWGMALLLYVAKRKQRVNYEGRIKETSRMLASQGAWLHSAPMEYLRLTPEGVVQSCSPGLRRSLGIVEHDMTLELLASYIHPEDFYLLRQTISMCAAQGGEGISILRKRKAPDQVLECVVVGADKTGSDEDIVVWLKDISEQRRTITSLQSNLSETTHERSLLHTLLSMSPFPVWRRNQDMKINYGNPSFLALVGASDQGAIPDIDRQASQLAAQAVTAGKPLSEKRHIIVGGERKFYTLTEVPLTTGQGTVGYAQDLSAVEVAETELQRHIHAHSDLLESSASAMAIFGQDQRLKFYNHAFLRLWKLEESWLESEPNYGEFLESLREKRKLPEQANFPVFKREQLGMFRDLIDPREDFYYMPDGMALRVLVIPHALGGLLFSYEDVTDKLALERSYNTLIAVQRATLDKLYEGVAVFAENGCLKLHNPVVAQLWGLDAEYLAGEPHVSDLAERCQDLYVFDDEWDAFKQKLIAPVLGHQQKSGHLETRDGKTITWRSIPLPDGAILTTYLDVTDSTLVERSLREKNEALQEADRLKSEFLANVSYELRSPLTSIIGFSEVLAQNYFGELAPRQREYVDGIHASSTQLMEIINDILDLASIEAGYLKLDISRFDLHDMLTAMAALVRERMKEQELTLEVRADESLGIISGDEKRLRQIIFNLLSNAIKFTPPGGKIILGAENVEPGEIMFYIQDTGVGIGEEELNKAFDRFYKSGSHRRHKSGAGLGLSIVKNFVELHGGRIELDSERGKGTTVRFYLPREARAQEPADTASPHVAA